MPCAGKTVISLTITIVTTIIMTIFKIIIDINSRIPVQADLEILKKLKCKGGNG